MATVRTRAALQALASNRGRGEQPLTLAEFLDFLESVQFTGDAASLASLALTTPLPASSGGTGLSALAANVVSLLGAATYAAFRALLGLDTGDSPMFSGVNVGHASDTTVSRASAGDIQVEGNRVFRVGGADVPVADGGTGGSSVGAALLNLKALGNVLLGEITAADMNTTADQAIDIVAGVTKWVPTAFVFFDASVSLTTAVGGVYSAASKGGTALLAASQVYSSLTSAEKRLQAAAAAAGSGQYWTGSQAFFSLSTPQGSASTCRVQMYGQILA